jgi:hypothetical protein
MAMEIKSPPVLYGEAARYFHKVAATMTESKSSEYVKESYRTTLAFLAKYDNPYKDVNTEE